MGAKWTRWPKDAKIVPGQLNTYAASNQAGRDQQQKVLVIVEGSREAVIDFSAFAKTEKPEDAEVSEVLIGDFDGFVPKMTDFAMILTAGQIVKTIPIIQEIESNTRETAESPLKLS